MRRHPICVWQQKMISIFTWLMKSTILRMHWTFSKIDQDIPDRNPRVCSRSGLVYQLGWLPSMAVMAGSGLRWLQNFLQKRQGNYNYDIKLCLTLVVITFRTWIIDTFAWLCTGRTWLCFYHHIGLIIHIWWQGCRWSRHDIRPGPATRINTAPCNSDPPSSIWRKK